MWLHRQRLAEHQSHCSSSSGRRPLIDNLAGRATPWPAEHLGLVGLSASIEQNEHYTRCSCPINCVMDTTRRGPCHYFPSPEFVNITPRLDGENEISPIWQIKLLSFALVFFFREGNVFVYSRNKYSLLLYYYISLSIYV